MSWRSLGRSGLRRRSRPGPARGTCGDLGEYLGGVWQRRVLHVVAMPDGLVQFQVGVDRDQRQGLAQLCQGLLQALEVNVAVPAEGELKVGLTSAVDQFEAGAGLRDVAGLADLGMVETNELRLLGAVAQGEVFGARTASRRLFTRRWKCSR